LADSARLTKQNWQERRREREGRENEVEGFLAPKRLLLLLLLMRLLL
jgi:hypothetical protein